MHAINLQFCQEIILPRGDRLQRTMQEFFDFYRLLSVAEAIDGTHITFANRLLVLRTISTLRMEDI